MTLRSPTASMASKASSPTASGSTWNTFLRARSAFQSGGGVASAARQILPSTGSAQKETLARVLATSAELGTRRSGYDWMWSSN
eukprot:scaffold1616_cov395-Prasinococcus_capsulatus_cf.AAC.10